MNDYINKSLASDRSGALYFGFTIILVLVLLLSTASYLFVGYLQQDIESVVKKNLLKIQLATEMRVAGRERTLNLYQMLFEKDVFERDEIAKEIAHLRYKVNQAKLQLEDLIEDEDRAVFDLAIANITKVVPNQLKVIELAMNEEDDKARKILTNNVLADQGEVFKSLDNLYAFQKQLADKTANEALVKQKKIRLIILLATLIITIISILVAVYAIRSEQKDRRHLKLLNETLEARVEERTQQVEEEQRKVSIILETVKDAIVTSDHKGIIETFNKAAETIFGYSTEDIIGKNVDILIPGSIGSNHKKYLDKYINGDRLREPNIPSIQKGIRRNGEVFPVEISLSTLKHNDEIKITALMRDSTERVKQDEKIQRLAMTDALTGLANRNQFNIRFSDAINLVKRNKKHFALILIDLDKFKNINDTYGHPFGDSYLQHVADLLMDSCREVDTVSRFGGDEFAIILHEVEPFSAVSVPVQRILEKAANPVIINNVEVTVGLSIGSSCYGIDSTEVEELMKMADEALYLAKKTKGSAFVSYNKN